MSNTDGLFSRSLLDAGKNLVESTQDDHRGGNTSAKIKTFIAILVALFVVGADGMRIIFRDNFGKKSINIFRIILCAVLFIYISYLLFTEHRFDYEIDESMSSTISFYLTGFMYGVLAIWIIVKGIACHIKAKRDNPYSDYKGDSTLLNFLINYGCSQNTIQRLVEPAYTTAIGTLIYLYNPIAGIPLIFCGVSLWGLCIYELAVGKSIGDEMKSKSAYNPKEKFTKNVVIND